MPFIRMKKTNLKLYSRMHAYVDPAEAPESALGTLNLQCLLDIPEEMSTLQWDTGLQTTGQSQKYKL